MEKPIGAYRFIDGRAVPYIAVGEPLDERPDGPCIITPDGKIYAAVPYLAPEESRENIFDPTAAATETKEGK